jgi:hypothetical protein
MFTFDDREEDEVAKAMASYKPCTPPPGQVSELKLQYSIFSATI